MFLQTPYTARAHNVHRLYPCTSLCACNLILSTVI